MCWFKVFFFYKEMLKILHRRWINNKHKSMVRSVKQQMYQGHCRKCRRGKLQHEANWLRRPEACWLQSTDLRGELRLPHCDRCGKQTQSCEWAKHCTTRRADTLWSWNHAALSSGITYLNGSGSIHSGNCSSFENDLFKNLEIILWVGMMPLLLFLKSWCIWQTRFLLSSGNITV